MENMDRTQHCYRRPDRRTCRSKCIPAPTFIYNFFKNQNFVHPEVISLMKQTNGKHIRQVHLVHPTDNILLVTIDPSYANCCVNLCFRNIYITQKHFCLLDVN